MRYISLKDLKNKIPNELHDEFDNFTQELLSKSSVIEAKNHIKSKGNPWSKLKPYFEAHFYGKCWYTESINPMASNDMDHFRPKNEVEEDKNHEGYWWLAYIIDNYRFSCQYANRYKKNIAMDETGGKNAKFPLLKPENRINSIDGDLSDEQPELFDPCNEDDQGYIAYAPTGYAQCKKSTDLNIARRFESTRLIYNLNYPTLVEEREKLYENIREIIELGDSCMVECSYSTESPCENNKKTLKQVQNILRKSMSYEAPYSLAAENYIRGFRYKDWVNEIFSS